MKRLLLPIQSRLQQPAGLFSRLEIISLQSLAHTKGQFSHQPESSLLKLQTDHERRMKAEPRAI
jgi:hypothetical protein